MQKYGFVYIWYDKKHKRYYIGCHWGREDDGYICSSRWMRKNYKRRPEDFSRRIISLIFTNRQDLLEEEYRWLLMIKNEELKIRYYNIHNRYFGVWSNDPKTTKQKMSESRKGKKLTENHKLNLSKSLKSSSKNKGKKHPFYGKSHTEEAKRKISESRIGNKHWLGKSHTEETKNKISKAKQGNKYFYGKSHTEEAKRKISESRIGSKNINYGKMWITDGIYSKTINKFDTIPEGWYKGRRMKLKEEV